MNPRNGGPDSHATCQELGGVLGSNFTSFPVLQEAARRGWGKLGGRPLVALMCLSWFAFLRVGEAASIRVADIRGEKALGFWATKRGIIGRRWRRWSEWSQARGGYLRDYTKGWEGEERVVPGGPPVYETALAGFVQGTEWDDGKWHCHRRGGGGGAGCVGTWAAGSVVHVLREVGG